MIARFLPRFAFALPVFSLGFAAALSVTAPRIRAADTTQDETSTATVYLSGHGSDDAVAWDFHCSDGRQSGRWTKIRVPSCWEQEGFGTYNYGMPFYGKANPPGIAREEGIYRTSFSVPKEWQGRRLRLVFEGVMTDAKVRVNGISAGPTHQGGFYRFGYDVTDLVKYGTGNELEVTVDKESANESVNLAERRADYWNFGGIFRPVFLQVFPARFIDRVAIAAQADGRFSVDVFLGVAAVEGECAEAQLLDASGGPVGQPFAASFAPGGDHVRLETKLEGAKTWSPETPELYRARISLRQGGVDRHVVTERFGFRTFEVRQGDGLYLNGRRILLKGINRHSFWPETARTLSRERNYDDVRLIRELNMNAVRMSHYPPDPEFLAACDELGLCVLDELGGWHGAYDSGVGRLLVGEMVRRDVNHPSILFWDNGNEGGWNTELDAEFARWDPQGRTVLHPQKSSGGVETMHYRSYGETQEYLRGREIYMPTEFLHGLYDGGHGAGLWDYWEMMRKHPRSGGGFLWVFADEGVARTDQGGRIDNAGNYGADGIVGPHHEREGSFNAVREIWSPVVIGPERLPEDFRGVFQVENRYDFTSLRRCSFRWELARFSSAVEAVAARKAIASGQLAGPEIAPGAQGVLTVPLPTNWREAQALFLTALDPAGRELWTWSWEIAEPSSQTTTTGTTADAKLSAKEEGGDWVVTAGTLELRFDKTTGELAGAKSDGHVFSLGRGPRFVAARRGDRTLDGSVNPQAAKGEDRVYREVERSPSLTRMTVRVEESAVAVDCDYFGSLQKTHWRIGRDGAVVLDYEYAYDGVVELMGVEFDYPESAMRAIRWLGRGPYRVWQNRMQGTIWGVWENRYNDPIPGESFVYPEFKGYFRDWRWAVFSTSEGELTMENRGAPGSFLGVYAPRDGRDALLYTLPNTGLAVLDVIPAVRNKVNATDLIGPSSQAQRVQGVHRGQIAFRFSPHRR
ncbi:glycoside hydrolase family 2 [Opitutaceae bacterium EW11]|nr:glycoside hydrolase family 2 [Opitutaceae bacterium EW11]